MTYVFTICEYGGGEMASCRLTCREEFADGFELGLKMRIDEDTHYIVREEIGEGDVGDHAACSSRGWKRPEALGRPREALGGGASGRAPTELPPAPPIGQRPASALMPPDAAAALSAS